MVTYWYDIIDDRGLNFRLVAVKVKNGCEEWFNGLERSILALISDYQ